MHLSRPRLALGPLALVAALALAACGGSNSDKNDGGGSTAKKSGSSGQTPASGENGGGANVSASQGQQKGGTLKVVSAEGWQHLDPGESYFQIDYLVMYAVHRPLYSFDPSSKLTPDLAAGPAEISPDGKTVTVKIKPNVMFSPPLSRAVTSDDVKYAFERLFNPNVPNGYATSYYPIVGADKAKGGPISGIETPDKTTIVFHLTTNYGATFAQALTLPGTAPVPKEVAGPMDKKTPTHVRQRSDQAGLQRPVHDLRATRRVAA